MYDFGNLGTAQNTGSGVAEYVLLAPVDWFASGGISSPVAPFNNKGDSVTVTTAHTFKTPQVQNIRAIAGTVGLGSGAITGVGIAVGGTGYVTPPTVTISGGGGSGAAITAIITNGAVTSIVITNPGTGYTTAPTITFGAPPTKTYGFVKFQLTPQKNKLSAKTVGDLGLSKLNQELDFFVGGAWAEQIETMQALVNVPLIVLVKDANCDANMFYQLGCDCQSAWASIDFETGTTKDGAKGWAGKIMYDGPIQLYRVVGGPTLLT